MPCHPSVPPQVPLGGTVGKGFFAGCLPPCRVPEVGVSGRNHINLGITISLFFLPLFDFLFIHHASAPGQPPPQCQSLRSLAHQTHSPKTRVPGVAWASPSTKSCSTKNSLFYLIPLKCVCRWGKLRKDHVLTPENSIRAEVNEKETNEDRGMTV